MMKLSISNIDKISYIYLSIPIFIFLFFWLSPIVGIISIIAYTFILMSVFKSSDSTTKITISKSFFILIICTAILWCAISGIGGLFCQTSDWHIRNAVFRDLVNFSYPVTYDNNSVLVYYIGQFLPATFFGKVLSFFYINPDKTFQIANIFNLFYCSFGIALVMLQLCIKTKINKYWCILILIFFSGMDVLLPNLDTFYQPIDNFYMRIFQNFMSEPFILHIERHPLFDNTSWLLEYSCNTSMLCWVYNQVISIWLVILLLMRKYKEIKHYGFYILTVLFFNPITLFGVVIYLFTKFIMDFSDYINLKEIKSLLLDIFSKQNIISVILLIPIFLLYYQCNSKLQNSHIYIVPSDINYILSVLSFILFEIGILCIFISIKYKRDIVFWGIVLQLIIIPFIRIDDSGIFIMRMPIPALFILMIYTIEFLNDINIKKMYKYIVVIILLLGAVTPVIEIYRNIYYTVFPTEEYKIIKDEIKTINNKIEDFGERRILSEDKYSQYYGSYNDYGTKDYDKFIFYKYLAKKSAK